MMQLLLQLVRTLVVLYRLIRIAPKRPVKFYLGTDTNRLVPLRNVTILSADGGTLTQQQSACDAHNCLMSGECHDIQHVSPMRADCSEDDLINTNTNAIGPRNDSLCSISHERFVADRIFPGGYFVLSPLPTPRPSPARDMTTDDVIVDEIQVDERFHVVEDTSKRHVDCTSESQLSSSSSSCDDVVGDMDEGSSADEMSEIDHQSPGSEFGSCSSDVHLDSDLAFERDVAEFLRQNFPNGNFQVIGDAGENEVLYEISFDDAKEVNVLDVFVAIPILTVNEYTSLTSINYQTVQPTAHLTPVLYVEIHIQ